MKKRQVGTLNLNPTRWSSTTCLVEVKGDLFFAVGIIELVIMFIRAIV